MTRSMLTTVCLFILFAVPAAAVTHTWILEDPALETDILVDFGATFDVIYGVQVQAVGYGGAQYATCEDMGNPYDLELNYSIVVELDAATGTLSTPLSAPYDLVDWLDGNADSLLDGSGTLRLSIDDGLQDHLNCWGAGNDPITITEVAIIVTAETVVAADAMNWSAIKSLYR